MKRYKRHKVKTEMPETSSSHNREQEEHDLAYYIHDRVELMHQVFSVLKYKELKAMAPACVRNISVDDLQELCTEELLGISSKRLCAILDGAEPPSDTESSSQSAAEPLETISLDSISSDEEILSQGERSKKKKHKHHRRESKSKSKRKKSKDVDTGQEVDKSKASRAGLTVLELLELQARARAIRAQLQQEQTVPVSESGAAESTHSTQSQSSEDEVEIKEEPTEVVEISSDEEKPKIQDLENNISQLKSPETQSKTVTKRVNDLVITVPQQKTQKIKLNRSKTVAQDTITTSTDKVSQSNEENTENPTKNVNKDTTKDKSKKDKTRDTSRTKDNGKKDKSKKKKKQRICNASDNDEITLQLSDSEKMDLLEDLDRKNYDNVSSDTSSDTESDADIPKKTTHKHADTTKQTTKEKQNSKDGEIPRDDINVGEERIFRESRKSKDETDHIVETKDEVSENIEAHAEKYENLEIASIESENIEADAEKSQNTEVERIETKGSESVDNENADNNNDIANSVSTSQTDEEIVEEVKSEIDSNDTGTTQKVKAADKPTENIDKVEKTPAQDGDTSASQEDISQEETMEKDKGKENKLSEGELSDRDSSEVEAFELKPEVVCISDEEGGKHKKKKKKKDKRSKKDKKSKKKDFYESGDQSFHNINESTATIKVTTSTSSDKEITICEAIVDNSSQFSGDVRKDTEEQEANTVEIDLTMDKSQDSTTENKNLVLTPNSPNPNINTSEIEEESANEVVEISDEVYELSDDSSNEDEAETRNVLSKEPTTSEIEALSAKIDEIERVEVITEEEINEYESKRDEEVTMSWKDRYLDSKKVKKVLNTSNILNALRKKNRELKKKLEESKIEVEETTSNVEEEIKDSEIPEGSIKHYNTLEASKKFVDPVKETPITDTLKKDAKQLLKMYKKLLKYNDMNRKKDPNKKKKKKKKGKKGKEQDSVEDKTGT